MQKIVDIIQMNSDKGKISNVATDQQPFEKGKTHPKSWILDTGATDHVTCDMSLFLTYYEIEPVKVRLPNNTQVIAKCVGTIVLSEDFIIYNVLFIPEFALNI